MRRGRSRRGGSEGAESEGENERGPSHSGKSRGGGVSGGESVLWFLLDQMHSYNIAKYIYHIIRSFYLFILVCVYIAIRVLAHSLYIIQ